MFKKIEGDLQTNLIFSTVFILGEVLDILDNFASLVMFRNFQETEWVISGWTADRTHNVAVGFDDCPWGTKLETHLLSWSKRHRINLISTLPNSGTFFDKAVQITYIRICKICVRSVWS